MSSTPNYDELAHELTEILGSRFPGIEVRTEHSTRWDRPCVTFVWKGFAALLPEERFHRLATVIPEGVRANKLAGFVWLELAPGEEVDAFLKLPRSEDVVKREPSVYRELKGAGFFEKLSKALGSSPKRKCDGGFTLSQSALESSGVDEETIRDAKLVFIRHGVYCDCQVLQTAEPALTSRDSAAS